MNSSNLAMFTKSTLNYRGKPSFFQVSGIAVLAVGIWVKVDKNVVSMQHLVSLDTSDKSLETAGWVLIGVGAFVLLISALGFLAAVKPNRFFTISVYKPLKPVHRVL